MNFKDNPQPEQLKPILSALDDSAASYIFWVDYGGEVHVSALSREEWPAQWAVEHRGKYKGRAETLIRGGGYTGPEAAEDKRWLSTLFRMLRHAWESEGDGAYFDY